MTDQKEIERVRSIHESLDVSAKHAHSSEYAGNYQINCRGAVLIFTNDEVKRWPEIKAELIETVRMFPSMLGAVLFEMRPGVVRARWFNDFHIKHKPAADNIARGLCMWREMLDDQPDQSEIQVPACAMCGALCTGLQAVKDESGNSFCCNPCFLRAQAGRSPLVAEVDTPQVSTCHWCGGSTEGGAQGCRVCYRQKCHEREIASTRYTGSDLAAEQTIAARTYEHPANVRARKVAALRAELDRPVAFPSEARTDRALPRANGMVKL